MNGITMIKNGSYQSHTATSNQFPSTTELFDTDDVTGNYTLIGDSPSDTAKVGTYFSNGTSSLGNGESSPRGWASDAYVPSTPMNYSRYSEYVRSRKEYQSITDLAQVTDKKANLFTGNLTIDDTNKAIFDNKNILLVVSGTLSFNTTQFIPANATTAIVAKQINFFSGGTFATDVKGLFIADTLDLGQTADPLKVTGNLVSTLNPVNTTKRARTDNRKPSLFVVFDPSPLVTLVDGLGPRTYDWRQIQ